MPEIDENSKLVDLLIYAELNNPGLQAIYFEWQAAKAKIPQVKALPDPYFNYTYTPGDLSDPFNPTEHKFSLMQMFPWFGKRNLMGKAENQKAIMAEQEYNFERYELYFQVKKAYYEYYYLGRMIKISRENLELVHYLEEVIRVKYETNLIAHTDLMKVQIELAKQEENLSNLESMIAPTRAALNRLLNRPVDEPFSFPVAIEIKDLALTEEELIRQIYKYNSEMQAMQASINMAKEMSLLAKKERYPDLTFGLEYMLTNQNSMDDLADNNKDQVAFIIGFNLPIGWGRYGAMQREANNTLIKEQNKYDEKLNDLLAELKMIIFNYQDAVRKINLYQNSLIAKSEQSLNVTRQAFIAGNADYTDWVDAQRTYLEFQLAYEKALTDKAIALAELECLLCLKIDKFLLDGGN